MRRRIRHVVATAVAAVLVSLAATGAAPAAETPDPSGDLSGLELPEIMQLLPGMVLSLAANRTDMLRCPTLAAGTIGLPETAGDPGRKGVDVGDPLQAGDPTDAPEGLPRQVYLRGTTQTYNRRYQFAVARGTIWYKSNTAVTGIHEPWAHLSVPSCFEGKVVGISVDDDELIALDSDRWIYGMDGALKASAYFNWSMRWGPPFWTGAGRRLPIDERAWSWSVLSLLEDRTWTDPAGNAHAVGQGKVSHIWLLSRGGSRLTYLDPWLPTDQSYEMCTPRRGRFRAAGMSASGSTVFLVGRYGDLYTRLYDFDISGADPVFFHYSYTDQRGVAQSRIQLPSPAWVRQPKIPGRITDRISIEKVGQGAIHRTLRVEGLRGGHVGFWHKDVRARSWGFTATGGGLVGTVLPNPPGDASKRSLAASGDRAYAGRVGGARISVTDFNPYCTPAAVRVRLPGGERLNLLLHTVDNIRQSPRARGLDDIPRFYNGMLEIPSRVRRSAGPAARAFLDALGPGRWVGANLVATTGALVFRHQPWRLTAYPAVESGVPPARMRPAHTSRTRGTPGR